jgi:thioredoxin 1
MVFMEKKNITPIVIGIVAVLAILGVGVAVKISKSSTGVDTGKTTTGGYCDVVNSQAFDLEKNNTASEIGEGEVKLTCENFKTEIEEYKGVAMVDMYSPTCPHCQKMGPIISEVAKETAGKYKIGKLNVMAYSTLGGNFAIESVPALIFFKDGKEVKRLIGSQSKEKVLTTLEEASK